MTDSVVKTCGVLCLFISSLFFAGCTAYQPPFTQHLTQDMTFDRVLRVAVEEGYGSYSEVAQYKGYRLLCFARGAGGEEVYLVVNSQGRPMMRTMAYDRLDKEKLVNFVDDLLKHKQG